MRILAVGGGSGGHVTPVVAVLGELKKLQPKAEVRFWCDKKFSPQARSIMREFDKSVIVQTIAAGKLRRYHHLSPLQHLLSPSLIFRNLIDMFFVGVGFVQSIVKLTIWRPDVVLAKGGFVCLPVGAAAHILRIPLVVHDSDAHPGLTNRILSKWASAIATGAPLENYPYPPEKSKYIGIPVSSDFHKLNDKQRHLARKRWGIKNDRSLIVVTGGGLGARRVNDTVLKSADEMLRLGQIVLISGKNQYDEIKPSDYGKDFHLYSFISNDIAGLLGAADVVITRAGATTLAELSSLAVPTVLIPNAMLTGGHQVKNASVYQKSHAAVVVDENQALTDPSILTHEVERILSNSKVARKLSDNISSFARPNAARDLAHMVIDNIK